MVKVYGFCLISNLQRTEESVNQGRSGVKMVTKRLWRASFQGAGAGSEVGRQQGDQWDHLMTEACKRHLGMMRPADESERDGRD